MYSQWSGIACMLLGLLFAVGELQGLDFSSFHAKVGICAILLALGQPLNAYFRPPKANAGERPRPQRLAWQWAHQ